MTRIRSADVHDLSKINEIYNFEVIHSTATLDTDQKTLPERELWFNKQSKLGLPVLVAEENNIIIAWAALVPWSEKKGYARSAEISIYVADGFRFKGIGKALLKELLLLAKNCKLHCLLARITTDNAVSIRMHESVGFFQVGLLREIGEKFGKVRDVMILQQLIQ